MTTYRRLDVSSEPRRPYQISVGLQEGFESDGTLHHPYEAECIVLEWIVARIQADQPFLSGTLEQRTVLYGIGSRDAPEAKREPAAIFCGFVSVRRTPAPSDDEVIEMLEELAVRLGSTLGQVRVNLEYCDRTWVLEATDGVLPREPHQ